MEFSHHSSNPLEARTSDSLNAKYHEALETAKSNKRPDFQSSDFGGWADQQDYHNHINDAVGTELFPPLPGPFSDTPKPGNKVKFIDLDAASEDELALKDDPETSYAERMEDMESIEIIDVTVPVPLEDEDDPDDVKVDEWDQPEGDFYGGEYLPEDDEMQSGGDKVHSGSMSPLTPISSSLYSSPQSSRPPSPDEAKTIFERLPEEQDEILDEMQQLYNSVPELCDEYDLVDRLGTGTFSSVYKAIDMRYNEWDNRPWLGHHPPESSAHYQSAGPVYKGRGGRATRTKEAMDVDEEDDEDYFGRETHVPGKVFVAIKRIYTTSGPERIRNELSILEDCRGCRHTSQIITAFRNNDQVVIVLPYQRNMDFREFYQSLHPDGIKCYFRCLFRALRDIHARGIIHRDVKPANFLYDPFTGIGTLCDFGLASRMEETTHINQPGRCLHDPPSEEHPHGRNRKLDPYEINNLKQAQLAARNKSTSAPEKVGYPEQDRRPISKANRAGTRGFRAPEVLLKCNSQTGAIDIWAAGIIMLFFLTGKFPIFQSNDDVEGLMEIALIIGRKNVEKVATLHGRTFATNVPDLDQDGITWREFVERLNPDITIPKKYDMRFYPHNSKHRDGRNSHKTQPTVIPSSPPATSNNNEHSDLPTEPPQETHQISERHANPQSMGRHTHQLSLAFHFLDGLLKFDSTKRYTPRQALYHNFLDEANVDGDDQFMPHRIGEGVCGEFHFRNYQSVHCVKVSRRCTCEDAKEHGMSDDDEAAMDNNEGAGVGHLVHEILEVEAGQGIPIGKSPCEYHRTLFA